VSDVCDRYASRLLFNLAKLLSNFTINKRLFSKTFRDPSLPHFLFGRINEEDEVDGT
jgi:hypothetical protein